MRYQGAVLWLTFLFESSAFFGARFEPSVFGNMERWRR